MAISDSPAPREVFQPKAFPSLTYVDRRFDDGISYEEEFRAALADKGTLVVVTGASKSGKTVLCHRAVPAAQQIALSGAQIQAQEDFWTQIAEQLDLPEDTQVTHSRQRSASVKGKASGQAKAIFAAGSIEGEAGGARSTGDSVQSTRRHSRTAIMSYLIENDLVLVIDDFHYIEQTVQKYIARTIKTELFNGLKAVILTLPHRSDDAIRLNPDLIGRTALIDIQDWTLAELEQIAETGFSLLGLELSEPLMTRMARECVASPQLMQENCLRLSTLMVQRGVGAADEDLLRQAFRLTAKNFAYDATILGTASRGPLQGKRHRTKYSLRDGRHMDIYGLLFAAISKDPPELSFATDELKWRIKELLEEKQSLPATLNIVNSLKHIESIIKQQVPALDTLEWKDGCLYILDPFLLFYLRWSQQWQK